MRAYAFPLGAAFLLSLILTAAIRVLAARAGLVDRPRPDRWHQRPVPRLGGVAIYLAFTAVMLIWSPKPIPDNVIVVLAGGSVIFLMGLVDDLFRLGTRPKLLLLIISAVIPPLAGVRFEMVPAVIGAPLAILWILGIANAFNWLDNMDGVAAGIAIIAAAHLVLVDLIFNGGGVVLISLVLVGAVLGFLVHNFPPARIFMGDAGSGFLGFTVATVAVLGTYRGVSNVLLAVLVPGMILAVPIFDTVLVTLLRALNRRPIFQGGRDHPAHRLVAMGLPNWKAALLLYGLSALAGGAALTASRLGLLVGLTVSIVLILGFVALGLVLADLQVYQEVPAGGGQTPQPAPLKNKKWIGLIGLDVVLIATAYVAAHLLRFEGYLGGSIGADVARTLPVMLAAKMIGFALLGVYRGAWRHAGIIDLVRLVEGASVGSLIGLAALFGWTRLVYISRAALVIDWLLTVLLLAGSRMSLRLVREYLATQGAAGRRALIVGSGEAETVLLGMLRAYPAPVYQPVGFVDDDPSKQGAIIQGIPVLGSCRELRHLIRRHRVEEVLLAAASCSPEIVNEIIATCQTAGVRARKFAVVLE